jgi:hypothetical protein
MFVMIYPLKYCGLLGLTLVKQTTSGVGKKVITFFRPGGW